MAASLPHIATVNIGTRDDSQGDLENISTHLKDIQKNSFSRHLSQSQGMKRLNSMIKARKNNLMKKPNVIDMNRTTSMPRAEARK